MTIKEMSLEEQLAQFKAAYEEATARAEKAETALALKGTRKVNRPRCAAEMYVSRHQSASNNNPIETTAWIRAAKAVERAATRDLSPIKLKGYDDQGGLQADLYNAAVRETVKAWAIELGFIPADE